MRTPLIDVGGAVEISEDRSQVWVAIAGDVDDVPRVQLIDPPREGVTAASAASWVDELNDRHRIDPWTIDPASPAGSLLLQLPGLNVLQPSARDVSAACGTFLDLVRDGEVKAARNRALRDSVRGAQARRLAGGIAWDRKAPVPAGPMLAASLALWGVANYGGLGDVTVEWEWPDPTALPAHLVAQQRQIELGIQPALPAGGNWPGLRRKSWDLARFPHSPSEK
jgi:hypothetical protein